MAEDINRRPLIVKGQNIGTFTIELVKMDGQYYSEIHLFIDEDKRRYSREAVKALQKVSPLPVVTSVKRSHKYVVRFLKMLGFEVIGECEKGWFMKWEPATPKEHEDA